MGPPSLPIARAGGSSLKRSFTAIKEEENGDAGQDIGDDDDSDDELEAAMASGSGSNTAIKEEQQEQEEEQKDVKMADGSSAIGYVPAGGIKPAEELDREQVEGMNLKVVKDVESVVKLHKSGKLTNALEVSTW